ncbi:MAG: leucine-rich repeat domain-containing protein [Treponema sp.]|nr:leucine-rich repeat domain-containing protein [Treponema sp.]
MLKSAKKKNVCYFVYLLFTAVFLFTSCDNMFHKPVEAWFEKYTDTAAIELQELDGEYPQNAKGITCIPSGDSHTVTFYLRNPQNYVLIPGFIKTSGDPYDTSDVIIEQDQDDRAIIRMRYVGSFLKLKDQETDPEAKSLSGRVTLVESESERSFEEWPVELSANSVPLPVKSPAFQVDGSDYSTANYWVCFYMPKYSTIEDAIHQDTKYLIVNGTRKYIKNDTIYTDEECTTADENFKTTKPSGLGNLSQLTENSNGVDFDFDETKCPDGYKVMYYNTKHHPSTDTYNVSFTAEDTEGLSSSISISNKAKQLVEPVFNVESNNTYDADETSFLYKVTISHPFTCTDDTSCGKGVTINYTITEENGAIVFADGTSSKLSGKATDKVTINLPKGKYKITADAVKNYYIASEKTEVEHVKVLRPAVYYISQTGRDEESTAGSSADPYRTIQYVIKKFFDGVTEGEYDPDSNCYIYVMTNLTAPDDFNWGASVDAFVYISPSSSYTGKITIKGSGGKRTIDLENNGKTGIFIAGGNVEIDNINLTNISTDTGSVYTIYTSGGNIIYSNGSVNNCKGINHGHVCVYNVEKFTMSNVSFSESGSDTGNALGAIKIKAGEVECKNCTFTKLTSQSGAGAIENKGTLTLTDCKFTNCSSNSHGGAIINDGGALTLTGVTIDGCKAGGDASWAKNRGGAIWNKSTNNLVLENVVIKNCAFNEGATTPLGAAIYSEDDIELKGKNTIINNKLPNGTASNVYITTTSKLKITGDITGSRIGINVPWTAGALGAPSVGSPVAFTDGYNYLETNSSKPGVIFTAENGYGITPITSGTGAGEAAFAVSSGAMYTALDYNFSFALKDVLGNTAHGFMPGKGASYTIVPTVKRTEATPAEPTTLHYKAADKELYVNYNSTTGVYSSPAAEGNKVTWTAALMNGSYKVADLSVTSTSSGIKVSVPDTVTREDTYTIKLSVKYLGITHDANFNLVCDNSAENAASYIASLTSAGTYDVKVKGYVGPAETDGLSKVANAIKTRSSGIYIKLDASETTVGGTSLVEYNDGEYFKACTALKEIKLPDWMEFVIHNLFDGCTNLSSVTLSENTQWICQDAFKNCSSLTSISIPAGITGSGSTHGIAKGAFVGCKSGFKIIYAGTREQWGAVKRPSDAWHDGATEPDGTGGSVICADGSRPGLDWAPIPDVMDIPDGTVPNAADYPHLAISSAEGFDRLATWSQTTNFEGMEIKLTKDVTVSDDLMIYQFNGTFDGNGKSITQNFTLSDTDDHVGFTTLRGKSLYKSTKAMFWSIEGASTIKNLTVKGNATRAGLVANMFGGTIEDCVSEVDISDSKYWYANLGGFVSSIRGSDVAIIKNCVFKGTINTTNPGGSYSGSGTDEAGGIAASVDNDKAIIDSCINKGVVGYSAANGGKDIGRAGGIVGYISSRAIVRNCKNMGTVCGDGYTAGIVSFAAYCSVINCSNVGVLAKYDGDSEKTSGLFGTVMPKTGSPRWPNLKNNCNSGDADVAFISYFRADGSSTYGYSKPDTSYMAGNYSIFGAAPKPTVYVSERDSGFTETNWTDLSFDTAIIDGFTSSETDYETVRSSLNGWVSSANTAAGSTLYKSWKLGSKGPELDLGELEDK